VPKPGTSRKSPQNRVSPYLLRHLAIDRPNQVWCADMTCVAMAQGFLYLVVIMDWANRCVLSWRPSHALDASFCMAALEDALTKGRPEIFNADQGAQFTSAAFTDVLRSAGIAISMDGRGRWMDSVFAERPWRSLKHEEIHLRDHANALEAHVGIGRWIDFYNGERGLMAFGYCTPAALWAAGAPIAQPPTRRRARPACGPVDNARALPACPQAQRQQQGTA
jgi:putative transposase